jgi:8-oxo-dGTP diphosphatase
MASTKNSISVAVDNVVLTFGGKSLHVLLVKRANNPFKTSWALPGGFVDANESLEAAALRELREETGIRNAFIEQLQTFGAVNRDPRGRVISVAYYALVRESQARLAPGDEVSDVKWFEIGNLPKLAFDHREIIAFAFSQLKQKFRFEPLCFELLPQEFTLTQLQRLYESVLETSLDKRNFRKKIVSLDLLRTSNEREHAENSRHPVLYKFDMTKFAQLSESGAKFTLY